MPMTITEKIIAAHTEHESVKAGQFVSANCDIVLANDVTAALAIRAFKEAGATEVFDRDKVVLIPDHYVPAKDIKSAEQAKIMREFANEQQLTHYYEVGRCGVEHAFLPEQGIVRPGMLIIGADSHTCTYGALGAFSTGVGSTDAAAGMATGQVWLRVPESILVNFTGACGEYVGGKDMILALIGEIGVSGALYRSLEFRGAAIDTLSMEDRLAMCNMAIEAGGKNGIIAPDAITKEYEAERSAVTDYPVFASDPDASYCRTVEINLDGMEPQIAAPPRPDNVKGVSEFSDVTIDQVVIGSCTNGRISDMRAAAEIIKGHKAAKNIRLIVIPATQDIYKQANDEGLLDIFVEAGGAVSTPTCGPCLGGYMGVLAAGERALATTNRNFTGRMGHLESEVFLCNPAVAAASAITGRITHPKEIS